MKYAIAVLCAALLLLSGCMVNTYHASLEKSAAVAIEKSIQNMQLHEKISFYIKAQDKIALVSMEEPFTLDDDLTALIEDAVIKQLLARSYTVLDRDMDIMFRSGWETTKFTEMDTLIYYGENGQRWFLLPTGFTKADKLIAYRIKEIGVSYESDGPDLIRKAHTILNIRIINAADNRILYADTMEGKHQDILSPAERYALEHFHYKNYTYAYPRKNPNKPMTNIHNVGTK